MSHRMMFVAAMMMAAGCGASPSPPPPARASVGPAPNAAKSAPKANAGSPGTKCIEAANSEIAKPIAIPTDITVSQVLVKHRDARQADGSERTREDACLRAQAALDALKDGESFDDVVAQFSDSKGAATTGGLIGKVTPGELGDPQLNEAAFALSLNQVSNVVESAFGFHIVLRTE